MKIKVIGKKHMEGTSKKTGNDYNFHIIYYVGHEDDRVIGQHGCEVNLDPSMIGFNDIQINTVYDIEFGPRNRVVAFEPVKG